MEATHLFTLLPIFRLFRLALSSSHFGSPPQMTSRAHRPTLIRLLQQLTSMQGTLRNQRIIVLPAKASRRMQSACNTAHGLKLTTAITDALFVHRECLCEELVADLFEPSLICDLTGCEEESEDVLGDSRRGRGGVAVVESGGGCRGRATSIKGGEKGVLEFEKSLGGGFEGVVEVFAGFEAASQVEAGSAERRCRVADALATFVEVFTSILKELRNVVSLYERC